MLVVFVGCGTVCANFQTTGLRCLALNQHSLGVTIMTMAVQIAASIGPFISVGAMSGIQGAVGEAQSALGYGGAWLHRRSRLRPGLASRLLGLSTAVEVEAQQC